MTRTRLAMSMLLLTTACESVRYGHVELSRVDGDPMAAAGSGRIVVPEGGVIVFEAQPRAAGSSPPYEGLERFELRSVAPHVAISRRTVLRDTWIVGGMSTGDTELAVLLDGDVVDEIAVAVVAREEDGQ